MENWQESHIKENLVELIKVTICNTLLLASLEQKKMLFQEEVDNLKLPTLTDFEKTEKLYKILLTRKGCFDILIETLDKINQTGAVSILRQADSGIRDCGLISYDKDELLGSGLSARVFRGKFDGRDVAVKIMNVGTTGADIAVREIELLKDLDDHENIVQYFFAEKRNMCIYIALELCYITLEDEVKKNLLGVNSTLVLEKCTKGLCHLHKLGVIHRDLTPSNILLTERKQVKISDFGLSKKLPDGMNSLLSISGAVGSTNWMAPEVLKYLVDETDNRSTFEMSKLSDIFSLGCIFYFVLTKGSHAFGHRLDIQSNIFHGKQQLQNSNIETEWLSIIRQMISHEQNGRPSADKLLSLIISSPSKRSSVPGTDNFAVTTKSFAGMTHSEQGTFKLQVHSLHKGRTVAKERILMQLFVTLLIVGGANRNITNFKGLAVLHIAVKMGNHSAIKYFIDLGADVNTKDSLGFLAIHIIQYTEQNFKETLDALIDCGADINAVDKDGDTLLGLAALQGRSKEELKYVVTRGGNWTATNDLGQSVLHLATEGGNPGAIKYLIDLGADIHLKDSLGNMPIHIIQHAKQNFNETLDALLDFGANINAVNREGNTPLGLAVLRGRSKAELEYVVTRGGDWKIKGGDGQSVLHLATVRGNLDAMKYFIDLGADVQTKDYLGRMPILEIECTKQNFKETLDILLDCGADINTKDEDGSTPLFLAARHGKSVEELKYIVSRGGDTSMKDIDGASILHYVVQSGNLDAITYFIKLGADILLRDKFGKMPIHYVRPGQKNFEETLRTLLVYGAETDPEDTIEFTLISLAFKNIGSMKDI